MNWNEQQRRASQGHGTGGRRPTWMIDEEVAKLRRYLRRPRSAAQIAKRFGWSERTGRRRMGMVGDVWRITRLDGDGSAHRTQHYVVATW